MLELMKKYLMTLLTLGLACNAAACMEDEPFYDTEIPPHASIDNSKGEGVESSTNTSRTTTSSSPT